MKKLFLIAVAFLVSLGVMAQSNADRTLQLYYGGEIIFSRAISLLDSLNFKVNKAVEDEEDDKPTIPDLSKCDINYSESGLYLGIIGFNSKLTENNIGLLTPNTISSYKNFVNNLTVGNATVLYYAEENALDRLTQASFPSDLISASIVTFTDGLDQGSVAYNEYYENMGIAQYLKDLNTRILSDKVCGSNIKIDAYSIGLQGKDVQDVDAFKNNLRNLSSSEDKMFEANDMDEVNETFNNIARSLYSATSIFSMTFNVPMPSNGEIIRFTFDDVEKAEDSKCYVEGTYQSRNLTDLNFEGCLYQGPSIIVGEKSGVEISFTFEGLSNTENEQLPKTNIQNFKKSSATGIWQLNSEFDGNSNVDIKEEQKTAVVMLVLDCSSSLGDDFAKMKSAANNFISLLLNASEQNKTTGTENGHDWMDLGLPSGTKWATMNVGASAPEDYGNYYAWGETSTKSNYDWNTYKLCNGSYNTQTKYCTSSSYGTIDNKTTLDLTDDAAYVNWGTSWRMPTKGEQDELRTMCTWTWGKKNGVDGYTVTGPNGNSIFLPAAGYSNGSDLSVVGYYGGYWCSLLGTSDSYKASYMSFNSSFVDLEGSYRSYGRSIRPVLR